MTTLPARRVAREERLRVLEGRRGARRILFAPWSIVVVVAVVGFLGLGFAQTSLDNSAFQLSDLETAIAEQHALNEELRLEVARLENPARIAPLAEDLGMVLPVETNTILVDLGEPGPAVVSAQPSSGTQ
jgi:cell division protein FtsL